MKKVISIMLVLVLCLGLCACGASKDQVRDDIINKRWYGSIDTDYGWISYTVRFSYNMEASVEFTSGIDPIFDGNQYIGGDMTSRKWEGTYEIKTDRIIISDSGKDFIVYYSFENGEISLTMSDGGDEVPLKAMPANAI